MTLLVAAMRKKKNTRHRRSGGLFRGFSVYPYALSGRTAVSRLQAFNSYYNVTWVVGVVWGTAAPPGSTDPNR